MQEQQAVEASDNTVFWDAPDAGEMSLEADSVVVADVYTDAAAQTEQHVPHQPLAISSTYLHLLIAVVLSWTFCIVQLTAFPWVCKLTLLMLIVAATAVGIQVHAPLTWMKPLIGAKTLFDAALKALTALWRLSVNKFFIIGAATHQGYCLGAAWLAKQGVEMQHGAKALSDEILSLLHTVYRGIQWVSSESAARVHLQP